MVGDPKVVFLATGVRFSGAGDCKVLFLATSGTGTVVLEVASLDLLVGVVEVALGMM